MIIDGMVCTRDRDGSPIVTVERGRNETDGSWTHRSTKAVAFHKAMLDYWLDM